MSTISGFLSRLSRRNHKHKQTLKTLIASAVALALLAAAALGLGVADAKVSEGTVIFGTDIGGMADAEAAEAVRSAYEGAAAVNFECRGVVLQRTLSAVGLKPDFDAIIKQTSSRMWWLGKPVDWVFLGDLDDDAFSSLVTQINEQLPHAQNARIETDKEAVWIVPSVNGLSVDADALHGNLIELFMDVGTRLEVPLLENEPEITTATVEAMGIERMLGSYTTYYTEDGARSSNIKLAAASLSGAVLVPGAELSFNGAVGPRSAEHGYKEANVYFDSRVERGVGGGVCQVSTTLYNAALLAGLEIVERHCHSLTVDYVSLGRDASVVYDLLDLVFKNDTCTHLLVESETGPGFVTFRLFGGGQKKDVRLETIILSETPYETEIVPDPDLPEGETEVTAGKTGYRVVTYRISSDPTDPDEPAERQFLGYSNYKPMTEIIKEGIEQ